MSLSTINISIHQMTISGNESTEDTPLEGTSQGQTIHESGGDCTSVSTGTPDFDVVIGHIEDVLIDKTFQQLTTQFLEKYWNQFEDSEENKLCYMDIFNEYNEVIEKYIERYLIHHVPGFDMEVFADQLERRRLELDGEVFEVLFTFTDFMAFKEMILDYRAMKEGATIDLSSTLCVTKPTSNNF